MQKVFQSILLAIFAVGVCLMGSMTTVFAGPAAELSSIRVLQVWSDGNQKRINVNSNYPNTLQNDVTFTGTKLFLKVDFNGHPNWATVKYRYGSSTGQPFQNVTEVSRQMKKVGNVGVGWIQTVSIPFSSFGGNYIASIVVTGVSANNPSGTKSGMVSGTTIQK